MSHWIDNDRVFSALERGDFSLLSTSNYKYCVSLDQGSCVLVRAHAAWLVPGEGWHDANAAPCEGEVGRAMLNFFTIPVNGDPGVWVKCFLPLGLDITSLQADTEGNYILKTRDAEYKAPFSQIPGLIWNLMTGHAQKEKDIETRFQSIWAVTPNPAIDKVRPGKVRRASHVKR